MSAVTGQLAPVDSAGRGSAVADDAIGPRSASGAPAVHGVQGEALPRLLVLLTFVLVTAFALLAAPARAEHDARVTADEPQYLLSAISLFEDRDLDIRDELRARRWRDFHEAPLPQQTRPLDDGRRISPHDPLLPAVLAVPVGLGGWLGAKAAMAALAGALGVALLWVAVHRFAVAPRTAALVVVAFAIVPPLAVYGTQIYPEIPAALAVTIAIAAVTGTLDRRGRLVLAGALVALPWLAVKYLPIVAVLAALAAWRMLRARQLRSLAGLGFVLGANAACFGIVHRVVYGGWTAYAAGDHFTGGEMTAIGSAPDYAGRSVRLLGLLVDRNFGLAAWAPAYLLAAAALAALLRRRPAGWTVLVAVLVAGWINATFVALTMHGWWWPGRQVVVVVPALVLAVAWFVEQAARHARGAPALALAAVTAAAIATWLWLLTEVLTGQRQLIIDFADTTAPLYRVWGALLPDDRALAAGDVARLAAWTLAIAALARWGWRSVPPRAPADPASRVDDRYDKTTIEPTQER